METAIPGSNPQTVNNFQKDDKVISQQMNENYEVIESPTMPSETLAEHQVPGDDID